MRNSKFSSDRHWTKCREQSLTDWERKALVDEALAQAERLMAKAFRLASGQAIIRTQSRVQELVVKEAGRRQMKGLKRLAEQEASRKKSQGPEVVRKEPMPQRSG